MQMQGDNSQIENTLTNDEKTPKIIENPVRKAIWQVYLKDLNKLQKHISIHDPRKKTFIIIESSKIELGQGKVIELTGKEKGIPTTISGTMCLKEGKINPNLVMPGNDRRYYNINMTMTSEANQVKGILRLNGLCWEEHYNEISIIQIYGRWYRDNYQYPINNLQSFLFRRMSFPSNWSGWYSLFQFKGHNHVMIFDEEMFKIDGSEVSGRGRDKFGWFCIRGKYLNEMVTFTKQYKLTKQAEEYNGHEIIYKSSKIQTSAQFVIKIQGLWQYPDRNIDKGYPFMIQYIKQNDHTANLISERKE